MPPPKDKPKALIWDTKLIIGLRYPLIPELRLVPLRPLARILGVSYESLLSAARRLPDANEPRQVKAMGRECTRSVRTAVVPAADLAATLLLARPRVATGQFQELRRHYSALQLEHLPAAWNVPATAAVTKAAILAYELQVERQRSDALRNQLVAMHKAQGASFAARRWDKGHSLSAEKMGKIVELDRAGSPLRSICFEMGLSPATVSKFLAGKYPSAIARNYYRTHGVPRPEDPESTFGPPRTQEAHFNAHETASEASAKG